MTENDKNAGKSEGDPDPNVDPKEEQITNLNLALKAERKQLKELKKELEDLKSKGGDEDNFRSKYEKTKKELEDLQETVDDNNSYFSNVVEEGKAKLGKELLELFPSSSPVREQFEWINKAQNFNPTKNGKDKNNPGPKAPSNPGIVNPGAGSDVTITAEEFSAMSLEERLKHLPQAQLLAKAARG